MSVYVELVGFKEFVSTYRQVPSGVQRRLGRITRQAGIRVREIAKSVVPVRTGALRSSIHMIREGPTEARVGSPLRYAGFVELGTRRMRSQPYLRPALAQISSWYRSEVTQALRDLTKVGGK